jgi:hypothetical protein
MAASISFAADYSLMSTQELQSMRGSIPAEERDAFKAEMQSRVKNMSQEEKDSFRQSNSGGSKQGPKDGTGNMYKGSNGGGGGGRRR